VRLENGEIRGGYWGRKEGIRNCGERTSFIGAMISGIAVCVVEEEGTEKGTSTED
jgi:hypothetical protein